jgi:integrase
MPLKIIKRPDSPYWQITGTHAGTRVRESAGTRDAKEADRKRIEIESRLSRAEIFGEGAISTFAEISILYMNAGHEETHLPPLINKFGTRIASTIKPGEITAFAKELKPNHKASTRNRHVIVPARAVINFGAELGLCAPIKVKNFKEAKVIKTAIDRVWIDAFMEHALHRHLGLLALFMFSTGARLGNAVRLTPADLDLAAGTATIGKTKNGDPHICRLTQELASELRTLPPIQVRDGSWRVFGYSTPGCLQGAWANTIKRAGLPYVCRHEAGRHSFATQMMVRSKVDLKTTQVMGGWKNPNSLLKYLHPEDLGGVAETVFGRSSDTNLTRTASLKSMGGKK